VIDDLRFAARLFTRAPASTLVALVTLSIAIAANAVLFSAVHAVLLRPLPYDRAHELFVVCSTYQGVRREFASFTDFVDWRVQSRGFTHMAAIRGADASLTTPDGPEHLGGAAVSRDFFALFGVRPFLGRAFLDSEHLPDRGRVVVLSHGLWRRRFGSDPGAVGRSVLLDGEPHTVIGVLPAGFAFPDDAELWWPLTMTASDAARRGDLVRVVGRMRAGVPPGQAQAELAAVARELEQRHPNTNAGWGVELVSLQSKSTEDVRRTLLALWGAVASVLLIASANISIMLLARGIRRAPELAVRAALGAGRGRLVRQMLSESALLGILGGIGGVVVANWGVAAVRAYGPGQPGRFAGVGLDLPVLAFTAALTLGTGLFMGLVPVMSMLRRDLHGALRQGGLSMASSAGHTFHLRALALVQVVVSLVLLAGAGLMIRTLQRLHAVDLGFNPDRLLTFYVSLPERRYPNEGQVLAFFDGMLDRLRALPAVEAVSAINALYIHWGHAYVFPVLVDGRLAPDRSTPPDTHVRIVHPDIHRVLQIPIRRGRSLVPPARGAAPPGVVVNEAMARRYFGHENPVGRRISFGSDGAVWHEIVGVFGDVRQRGLDTDVAPEVHVPYEGSPAQMAILVRTSSNEVALVPTIRAEVEALDPNLPIAYVQTMDEVLARSLAPRRFGMRLLSAFAAVSLLLTAIGLHGVVTAIVTGRTREMAVRLALGASPRRLVWTAVVEMISIVLGAVMVGIAIAHAATRFLDPLLFGVPRTDAATYGAAVATLMVVALISAYAPARRLARVDPAVALRST
jgi:putative ABC transport system permease protein